MRRSLQESCCESAPTESDLNFYANYLLLSAEAACAEQGSVGINDEEWNTATNDLVKLFGATQCWGVEPCEEEEDVVSVEVPPPSPVDENTALSEDTPSYYDGPTLSDNGQVCTITAGISADETRSLELSFYYQVETKTDSLDLGLVERALIEKVCEDAGNERRLNELETEVVAVDTSPEDVVSEVCKYECILHSHSLNGPYSHSHFTVSSQTLAPPLTPKHTAKSLTEPSPFSSTGPSPPTKNPTTSPRSPPSFPSI